MRWTRAERRARGPLMWVLLAISTLVAWGCWAISSPTGSSPDDDFHLSSVWCAGGAAQSASAAVPCAETGGFKTAGTVNRIVPVDVASADCFRFPTIADCWHFKGLRHCSATDVLRSVECAPDPHSRLIVHATNDGLYPPGFYAAMHSLVSGSVDASVLSMRAVNLLLAMVLVGAALGLAQGRLRAALALTMGLAVCVPNGLFFIPSTNPTSWSVIGIGTLWAFVLTFMTTTVRWRRYAALVGAVTAWLVAVSARTDAPVFAGLSVATAAMIGTTAGARLTRRLIMPAALVVVSAAILLLGSAGGVASNGVAPVAAGNATGPNHGIAAEIANNVAHPVRLLLHNMIAIPWEYEKSVLATGPIGWGDVSMSRWGGVAALALIALMVFAAVIYRGWDRAAYVCLILASVVIPLVVMQQSRVTVAQGFVQPRYMYPLAIAVVGLGFYAFVSTGLVDRMSRKLWTLIWAVQSALVSVALHIGIDRYTGDRTVPHVRLEGPRHWWWHGLVVSPLAVWAIGSVAMAAVIALLLRIAVASSLVEASDPQDRTTIDPRESSAA